MRRLAALIGLVSLCSAAASGVALGDGDPASDYLITQPAFLPFDAHVDQASSSELAGLLASAKKKGFEIRVAVISTKLDLGAVPILYRKPQIYAHFLGQELFYWYKRELLVVMPNGYGVYRHGLVPADQAAVDKLPPPGSAAGNTLVAAANRAVRALAARHGVTLVAVSGSASSSTNSDRIVIAGAAAGVALLTAGVIYVRRRR